MRRKINKLLAIIMTICVFFTAFSVVGFAEESQEPTTEKAVT